MTPLIDRLRHRGWRLTAQRRVIAEVLTDTQAHLSAEEVLERARAVMPAIGLATVYRTLHELVSIGELLELPHDDGRKRYDPVTERHHHLVCVACGRMLDVHTDDPDLPADQLRGFEVIGVDVTFRARCPGCADAA